MRSRDLVGSLTLVTAPAVEPVTVEEAGEHLRVDTDVDDTMLARLITAARGEVEAYTRRSLVTTSWRMVMDWFPGGCVEIPQPPNLTLVVKYDDASGTEQTVDPTTYVVTAPTGPFAERATVQLKSGQAWPTPASEPGSVRFEFDAGYGPAGTDVPDALRQAVLMLVAEMYERRTEVTVGASQSKNVITAERLMNPYRSIRW